MKKHTIDGISNNFEQTGPPFIDGGIAEAYFYDNKVKLIKYIRYDPYFGYGIIEVVLYEYYLSYIQLSFKKGIYSFTTVENKNTSRLSFF